MKERKDVGDQEPSPSEKSKDTRNLLEPLCKDSHSRDLLGTKLTTTVAISDSKHLHSMPCKKPLKLTLSASSKMSTFVLSTLEELPSIAKTCTLQEESEVKL